MKVNLIFFDRTPDIVRKLQEAFLGEACLSARQLLAPSEIATHEGIDALYLTLSATERWGIRPEFYKSQVIETGNNAEGWPQFIIAGIALRPDDSRAGNPAAELKLTIEAF